MNHIDDRLLSFCNFAIQVANIMLFPYQLFLKINMVTFYQIVVGKRLVIHVEPNVVCTAEIRIF